jgi:hypothetical protein
MPDFLFAYHGGKPPEAPEDMQAEMDRWKSWFDDIGASVVDPGNLVGMSRTVSADGVADDGGTNPVSGYTVVRADSIDAAIAMAKTCPILSSGTIEVAEIHEVDM